MGSMIAFDNTIDVEINNRIRAARGAFGGLWNRVWSQYGITISTKCKVYKAIVLPTLLYSTDTYTLYLRHIRKKTFPNASLASTTNPSDLKEIPHFKCRRVETGHHVIIPVALDPSNLVVVHVHFCGHPRFLLPLTVPCSSSLATVLRLVV